MGKKGSAQVSGFSGRTIGNMIKRSSGPTKQPTQTKKKK